MTEKWEKMAKKLSLEVNHNSYKMTNSNSLGMMKKLSKEIPYHNMLLKWQKTRMKAKAKKWIYIDSTLNILSKHFTSLRTISLW